MPYKIKKVPRKNCYSVRNIKTKQVFSKCSTLRNATKQMRLLNAIKHNKSFKPRNASKMGGNKTRKSR